MKGGSDIPNIEAVAEEIENMLEEAWNKFCDYYDTKAPRYRDSWRPELDRAGALESHWICWDENDLTFHIGRFFYDILKEKKESLFSNIEIHFEKKVDPNNFSGYEFENNLKALEERLINEGIINKLKSGKVNGPKVDIIVTYDNRPYRFLLCAEAKCFRGGRYERPIEDINIDRNKLIAIRDLGIAKRIVFILFDDYYYCNDEDTSSAIEQRLDEIRNEDGITVLFHTSEAKLENY